ncbi:hypothetical protein [Halomontanus rarus]|uniref:hypothetical protein n=1 Tax=Halomontanus rarus TaxID=3034020 RepID=UPI001A992643
MGRERVGDASAEHAAAEIDQFLSEYGVNPEDIGIVLGPKINYDGPLIMCDVRVVDGRYEGAIDYSVTYRFDLMKYDVFVEDIYSEWIDVFESRFSEADLQYWQEDSY